MCICSLWPNSENLSRKVLVYPVVRRWQFCPRFCQCVWFWGVSEYEWYFSWLSVHHVCVSWQGITQATSVLVCKATERGQPGGWELESFRQSSKLSSAAVAIAVCVLVRVFAWKCLRNADEVELPTKIGLLLLKRASSLECFLRGIQRQWNNGHHHVAVIDDALVLGLARWAAWLLWSERCACWADFCTNVANYERGKVFFLIPILHCIHKHNSWCLLALVREIESPFYTRSWNGRRSRGLCSSSGMLFLFRFLYSAVFCKVSLINFICIV